MPILSKTIRTRYLWCSRNADDQLNLTSIRLLSVTEYRGKGRPVPQSFDWLLWQRIRVYSKRTLPRAPRISPRALPCDPAYVPSVSSTPRCVLTPFWGEGHLLALSLRADVDRARVRALNALQNLYHPERDFTRVIQIVRTKTPVRAVIPR